VDRLLALPTPPSSPLTPLSSLLPQIPSPPLPVSSPLPISPPPLLDSPTHPLGYRAAMIQLRAESPFTSYPLPLPPHIVLPRTRASMAMMRAIAPSTYCLVPRSKTPPSGTPPILLIPLPTSSPPLLLPSIDCRAYFLEVTLPPWKRLCIAPGLRYEVRECSSAPTARPTGGFRADYAFVGTLDAEIRRDPDREIDLGQRMTDFVTTVRQDTDEIYGRVDDAQDDRSLMSGQLKFLRRDRRSHARTTRLMDAEARASREAWVQSMDASDMTQMAALQSQQRPARDPAHPDVPEETGVIFSCDLKKMPPRKAPKTRTTPATTTTPTTSVTDEQLKRLIAQGVVEVLAEREATRSGNGKDNHDSRMGGRRQAPLGREMETVFRISNCTVKNQIKFATCTLIGSALTWWNSHVRTVGHDVAYAMTWTNLKKMMIDKYCPSGEIKKLEVEMWNLKSRIRSR
ncbi:putative reverse transcriptase domain-containing protein, partial [Tanacetum coccineum]